MEAMRGVCLVLRIADLSLACDLLACARGLRVGRDGTDVDLCGDNFLSTYVTEGANELEKEEGPL